MYEFFVATIPRLGRYLLGVSPPSFFFLLEGSILVCQLLATYFISLSVVWGLAHEGTTGVLTWEASQAAKLIFEVRHWVGFESARLAWDEYTKWLLRSPLSWSKASQVV